MSEAPKPTPKRKPRKKQATRALVKREPETVRPIRVEVVDDPVEAIHDAVNAVSIAVKAIDRVVKIARPMLDRLKKH